MSFLQHAVDFVPGRYRELGSDTPRLRPSTPVNNDSAADQLPDPTKLETFRLVELLPGTTGDPTRCLLHEVPATTDPSRTVAYEALSYCWGNPQHETAIECNGRLLKIPSSLAAALGGLRHRDRPRHLWADAICIDQSDPLDKAMQVPHMRSIYSGAQRTLVWLGTMTDTSAGSASRISLAARACVRLSVPLHGLADRRSRATRPTVGVLDRRTGQPAKRLSVFSGSLYLSLAYMLRQPWFRRAWVVQEVAVAAGVTILFDHLEYDWDEVVAASRFLSGVKFPLAFLPSPQHLAAIDHERNLHSSLASSLPGVLVRHQRCRATDTRDKIFAFAGLVSPASAARDVRVTYADADSPAVVFRELATKIILRDRSLDILSGLPTTSKPNSSLPSWVPDWSSEPDYLDRSYTWSVGPATLAGTETRDGLGDRAAQCRFAATRRSWYEQPDISDGKLTVPGHLLGTVTYAGPSFTGVRLPAEVSSFRDISKGWMGTLRSVLHARDVLADWKSAVASISSASVYYPTGENMDVAFWQTICAGEYATSPALQRAATTWKRLMRGSKASNAVLTGVLRSFDLLGAFYSTLVFVLVLLKNDPVVEHRLQGRYALNRRLVKLDRHNNQGIVVGLANCVVDVGDEVFLLQGSNVPLILRRRSCGEWRLVGDVYVHGFMNGEAWDETKCRPVCIT